MGLGSNQRSFEPASEGNHAAVLVDIFNLGLVKTKFLDERTGQPKEVVKVQFIWQLEEEDDRGLPYLAFKQYTDSLNPKATLYKDLKSWFKKDIDKVVAQVRKDETVLLGKRCTIEIEHSEVGEKTYSNVVRVAPAEAENNLNVDPRYVPKKKRAAGEGPFGKRLADTTDPDDVSDDDIPF
jgi:hypothetical protein